MRVVDGTEKVRFTKVELSDQELQFIERALFQDSTNNDENGDLWEEVMNLRSSLVLTKLDAVRR